MSSKLKTPIFLLGVHVCMEGKTIVPEKTTFNIFELMSSCHGGIALLRQSKVVVDMIVGNDILFTDKFVCFLSVCWFAELSPSI